jgi:hypothetical protein
LISLWAALNASTWLRTLGEPVGPLGPHALWDPLLGALNIGPPAGVMSRSPR